FLEDVFGDDGDQLGRLFAAVDHAWNLATLTCDSNGPLATRRTRLGHERSEFAHGVRSLESNLSPASKGAARQERGILQERCLQGNQWWRTGRLSSKVEDHSSVQMGSFSELGVATGGVARFWICLRSRVSLPGRRAKGRGLLRFRGRGRL